MGREENVIDWFPEDEEEDGGEVGDAGEPT